MNVMSGSRRGEKEAREQTRAETLNLDALDGVLGGGPGGLLGVDLGVEKAVHKGGLSKSRLTCWGQRKERRKKGNKKKKRK